jgi:hypothetical protein
MPQLGHRSRMRDTEISHTRDGKLQNSDTTFPSPDTFALSDRSATFCYHHVVGSKDRADGRCKYLLTSIYGTRC